MRRHTAISDKSDGIPALAQPLQKITRARQVAQSARDGMRIPAAVDALPAFEEALDAAEQTYATWAKDKTAFGKRRAYVAQRVEAAKLHEDPGMQAAMHSLGVPGEEREKALRDAADELRWERALNAALDHIEQWLAPKALRKELFDAAMATLRTAGDGDVKKALQAALTSKAVDLSGSNDPTLSGTRVSQGLGKVAPYLDQNDSDTFTPDELLRRLAQMNGQCPDAAYAGARDAFLGQEDNRLTRAWEYTLASGMEKMPANARSNLLDGVKAAMAKALQAAYDQLKVPLDPTAAGKLMTVARALYTDFEPLFDAIETRYDATVEGPPAKDGHSSSGGFCLFHDGTKIEDKEAYDKLVLALLEQARKKYDSTADEQRSKALVAVVNGKVVDPQFTADAIAGTGKPQKVAQPWMISMGGYTDEVQQLYYGQDNPLSHTDSSSYTKPVEDGEGLMGFLVHTLKGMSTKLGALDGSDDSVNASIPVNTSGLHTFNLRPGSPFLQQAIKGSKNSDQVVTEFKAGGKEVNDARKAAPVTEAMRKKLLEKEFGAGAGNGWDWIIAEGFDHGTVAELLEAMRRVRRLWTDIRTKNQTDDSLKIGALAPANDLAREQRLAQVATAAQRDALFDKLLKGVSNAVAIRSKAETAAGVDASLKDLADAVAAALVDRESGSKAISKVPDEVLGAPEKRRRAELEDPRVLSRAREKLYGGWGRDLVKKVDQAIKKSLGHAPKSLSELVAGFKAIASPTWLAANSQVVDRAEALGVKVAGPCGAPLQRTMTLDALGTSRAGEIDAALAALGPLLSGSPTVAEVADKIPGAIEALDKKKARKDVAYDPRQAKLDGPTRTAIYDEYLKGQNVGYRNKIIALVEKSPNPKDVPTLLKKLNKVWSDDDAEGNRKRALATMMDPELGVFSASQFEGAITSAAERFGVARDKVAAVTTRAKNALGTKKTATVAVLEKAVKDAIVAELGALKLATEQEVRTLVGKALKALAVEPALVPDVTERAMGSLEPHLPASAAEIKAEVTSAIQLIAVGRAIDKVVIKLNVGEDQRFAVKHQTLLGLEKRSRIDAAAIEEEIGAVMERLLIPFQAPDLTRELTDAVDPLAKAPTTDPKLDATLGSALDEALHERIVGAVPPPGVVIADTNWGDGDTQSMFSMVVNPVTDKVEMWQMGSDGSNPVKVDQDEWIKNTTWEVYDDPDQYGGVL